MNYKEFNPCQQKIMALLAYNCLSFYWESDKAKENPGKSNQMSHLSACIANSRHACALLGVPDAVILRIISGEITGLQNLNRFSDVVLFENNYTFNIYA